MPFLLRESKPVGLFVERIYNKAPIVFKIIFDLFGLIIAAALYTRSSIFLSILLIMATAVIHTADLLPNIRKNTHLNFIVLLAFTILTTTKTVLFGKIFNDNFLLNILPPVIDLYRYILLLVIFGTFADNKKTAFRCVLSSLTLSFIVYFYLPSETFVANAGSFGFYYDLAVFFLLQNFLTAGILTAFLIFCVPKPNRGRLLCLVTGIIAAVYIQYMFMNGNLDKLGMASFDWTAHSGYAVLNLLIWVLILTVPFVIRRSKPGIYKKISVILPAFLLLLHIFSLILAIALTNKDIWSTDNKFYMSNEEMYTVSPNKNVIVLVFDAADNYYIENMLKEKPQNFDGLEDFTVYTNTCSIYDYTTLSFMTMFGGLDFMPDATGTEIFDAAWNSDKAHKFYDTLHDLNFKVNAYNMAGGTAEDWIGLIDNALEREKPEKPKLYESNNTQIENGMRGIGLYRALPFAFKKFIGAEKIDFRNAAFYYDLDYIKNYNNDDFLNALKLKTADTDKNYFIIQHTIGMHYPCNNEGSLNACLDIVKEYVKQLKALNIYDDSVIIAISDHGEHTVQEDTKTPFAATPILMIKRAGASNDKCTTDNTPIYFSDLLSTFAQDAGLEKQRSVDAFGPSVYDIDPEKPRSRTWYDRHSDKNYPTSGTYGMNYYISHYNTYYAYTYTGDRTDLEKAIGDPDKLTIYPIKECID